MDADVPVVHFHLHVGLEVELCHVVDFHSSEIVGHDLAVFAFLVFGGVVSDARSPHADHAQTPSSDILELNMGDAGDAIEDAVGEGVLKESASISALSNYLFTFDKYCKDKNENPEVTARAREFIEYLRKNKSEELQQWLLGNTSSTTNLQAMLRTFPGWKGFGDNSKEGLLNFNAFSLLDTVSLYNKSSWKFEKNEVDMYANDYTEDDSYPHDFVLSDGRFLFLVEQDFGDMAGETNYYYRYFVSDTEDIKDAKEINYKEAAALLSPEDKTELERIKNSLADENTNRSRAFVEKRKVQENKKIIDDLPGNPFRKKNKKFEEGEIVWDSGNKRYGVILKIYNDTDDEVRLDSDGMQPVENLFKLGSPNDKGTKADLIECLKSHKRLIDEWPKNYERIKY